MQVEPALHAADASEIVGRSSGMGGEGAERLVVLEHSLRDEVCALCRTVVVLTVDVVLILARPYIEGVERRIVVVAQPAKEEQFVAYIQYLIGKDVHTGEHDIVVEGGPTEVLDAVANDEHLQSFALLQGAIVNLGTGPRQDERLQVVGTQ